MTNRYERSSKTGRAALSFPFADTAAIQAHVPTASVFGRIPASKARVARLAKSLGVRFPPDYRGFLTSFGALVVTMELDKHWNAVAEAADAPAWAKKLLSLTMLGSSLDEDVEEAAAKFRALTNSDNVPVLQFGISMTERSDNPDCLCLSPEGSLLEWTKSTGSWRTLDESFGQAFERLVREQGEHARGLGARTARVENREAFLADLELSGNDETIEEEWDGFRLTHMSVTEAVAIYAGIEARDESGALDWRQTASPVLGSFVDAWAYGLRRAERQVLKRYIPLLAGSRSDAQTEDARACAVDEWHQDVLFRRWFELVRAEPTDAELQRISHEIFQLNLSEVLPAGFLPYLSKIAWEEYGAAAGFTATNETAQQVAVEAAVLLAIQELRPWIADLRTRLSEDDAARILMPSDLGLSVDDLRMHLQPIFASTIHELQESAHALLAQHLER